MRTALRGAVAAIALCACAGPQAPGIAELEPIERASPRPQPLPDEFERAAESLVTGLLARAPGEADLRLREELRALAREPAGGRDHLADLTDELYHAAAGHEAYTRFARERLDAGDLDPALEQRLERHVARQPLEVARTRLREDRLEFYGTLFNTIATPAARAALGDPLSAVESGRAAIVSLLILDTTPEITTRERQALAAYKRFLEVEPGAADAGWVRSEVARFEQRLTGLRVDKTLRIAQSALDAGRPDAALVHLDRLARIRADDPRAEALERQALADQAEREVNLLRSLTAIPRATPMAGEAARADDIARAILLAPLAELPEVARKWAGPAFEEGLRDELEFLSAAALLSGGDEDGYYEAMRDQATRDPNETTMGRHAIPIVTAQNPYGRLQEAESEKTRRGLAFLFLGRRAEGPLSEGYSPATRPLALLLEVPGYVTSLITIPVRLLQLPGTSLSYAGPVVSAGEEYLERYPQGQHAREVHARLERLYSARSQWSQALSHHRALGRPDPSRVSFYRERIAQRTLEAARLPRRIDVKAAIYRQLVEDYGDTRAGRTAGIEFEELRKSYTPQAIRVSKAFLVEHPDVAARGALGLRAALLDGDEENGELAEEGVTLIGRTYVRLAFDRGGPRDVDLGCERFAQFIARLEQAYRSQMVDEGARPESDPKRDAFFEQARLCALDVEAQLAAGSTFAFLAPREIFGPVRRRESILPVELVVRGGLDTLGLAAVPRVRMPRETADAFLYR